MALFLPEKPKKGRNTRILRGTRPSKKVERDIFAELERLLLPIVQDVAGIFPEIDATEDVAVVMQTLDEVKNKWARALDSRITAISDQWTRDISEQDKEKLEKSLAKTLAVDNVYILDEENVADAVIQMQEEMRTILRTIPEKYIDSVQKATFQSFFQIPLPENRSLLEEIIELSGIAYERAKVIARDQTNKFTSVLAEARQTDLGIEEYIWRTAEDQRVVGNPSGKYPKVYDPMMHGNHFARNGKIFRWDSPPEDGHPGWAIQCRCYAEPILDMDKVKLV